MVYVYNLHTPHMLRVIFLYIEYGTFSSTKSPLVYQQHKTIQSGAMRPQLNTDMKQGSTSVIKSNTLSFLSFFTAIGQ